MRVEELVERYIDAWNRRDLAQLLSLLHAGAAYYDALWRELCVGRDLPKYLRDGLDEDQYWYEITGDLVVTDNNVAYHYVAYEWDGAKIGADCFQGMEVLVIADDKIMTISNHYYDPDPIVLQEIVRLAVRRHGEKSYADGGNGAYKYLHVKSRLSTAMDTEKVYLDCTLSLADLAQRVRCEVEQLLKLIRSEFGADFEAYVTQLRLTYASDILSHYRGDPNRIARLAADAGFGSTRKFREAFKNSFGSSPEEFSSRAIH